MVGAKVGSEGNKWGWRCRVGCIESVHMPRKKEEC